MTTEIWIAILTLLTSAAGAIRWLIHVYWDQAKRIEDLHNSHQKQYLLRLEASIGDHRRTIEAHQRRLDDIEKRILNAQGSIVKSSEQGQSLLKLVHDYIDTSASRLQKQESEIKKITENLIMIKTKAPGGKTN